jgi:hypothetical protein
VESVGSDVTDFRPGDRVLVGAITPDWGDLASQNGHPSQSGGPLGGFKFANLKDGVFAEFFHVGDADANLAKIPDGISDEAAVHCADMLSTGFMGAEHGNIPMGGTAAVLAQGPVGLMATAGARLLGAGLVIGVESVPSRQELARFYGADEIVDFTREDVVECVLELVGLDGTIPWMCLPRFDSEPLFCALLDRTQGGQFTVTPENLREARQRYDPDTGVLHTELRSGTGLVRVTDALVLRSGADLSEDAPSSRRELVRSVLVLEGDVRLRVELEPRGGAQAHHLYSGLEVQPARHTGRRLHLRSNRPLSGLRTVHDLRQGDRLDLVLSWGRFHRHHRFDPTPWCARPPTPGGGGCGPATTPARSKRSSGVPRSP